MLLWVFFVVVVRSMAFIVSIDSNSFQSCLLIVHSV